MNLALVRVPEGIEDAARIARRLSAPPVCGHYRWKLDPIGVRRWDRMCRRKRRRVPPCLCSSATDVHPDCPWVTWQTVTVQRLPDGSVVLGVEDPDRHGETRLSARVRPTEREAEEAEVVWSAREDRRAARRETEPAPAPERGARR